MAQFRVSEGVIWEQLDDEIVLLSVVTGTYFALNPTGARAFLLLVELGDIGAVTERMAKEYLVPNDRLSQDLDDLVQELLQRELIERAGP